MPKITNTILASFPGITGEMSESQVAALDKLFTVLGKQIDSVEIDEELVQTPDGETITSKTTGHVGIFGRQWEVFHKKEVLKTYKMAEDGAMTTEVSHVTRRNKTKFTAA